MTRFIGTVAAILAVLLGIFVGAGMTLGAIGPSGRDWLFCTKFNWCGDRWPMPIPPPPEK